MSISWCIHWLRTGQTKRLVGLTSLAACLALTPWTARPALAAPPASPPKAFISIVIDDYRDMELWEKLADDCKALGITTTLALDTLLVKPEDWQRLAARVAQGHEIASHSRNHVPLSAEEGLNLRYYAPASKAATAVVDASDRKLRVFVDGTATPALEFDLAATGPTPTLGALAEAVNKVRGFAGELTDPRYANIQSEFLAASPGTDIFFKNGFAPLFLDHKRFSRYELEESKRDIESNIPGYACTSIVYPYLANDEETRRIARELGYNAGRTGENGSFGLGAKTGYDVMAIWAQMPRFLFGETEAPDFAKKVAAFLADLKKLRGAVCIYSHGPNEYSNADWQKLIKLLVADPEVRLVTIRDMARQIETLTQKGSDGLYRLKPGN